MSLEWMQFNATTGTVINRSKMHLGLQRNLQVMPRGRLAGGRLCKLIPDRHEHRVRCVR